MKKNEQEGVSVSLDLVIRCYIHMVLHNKQTLWSYSVKKLYRPSDCRLLAKLVPTFVERRYHMVNAVDPHSRIDTF
jgi:hypothetical protein